MDRPEPKPASTSDALDEENLGDDASVPDSRRPGSSSEADDPLRSLLKRSLDPEAQGVAPDTDLLTGVQRKLRKRSRGKFYGDGWSTANARAGYLLAAIVMLVLVAIAYLALGPTGFH